MYYLCSENKGADQLRGYREADLRLCFRICPQGGSIKKGVQRRMVLRVIFSIFFLNISSFVVAIFDLVHDVEWHGLYELLIASGNLF